MPQETAAVRRTCLPTHPLPQIVQGMRQPPKSCHCLDVLVCPPYLPVIAQAVPQATARSVTAATLSQVMRDALSLLIDDIVAHSDDESWKLSAALANLCQRRRWLGPQHDGADFAPTCIEPFALSPISNFRSLTCPKLDGDGVGPQWPQLASRRASTYIRGLQATFKAVPVPAICRAPVAESRQSKGLPWGLKQLLKHIPDSVSVFARCCESHSKARVVLSVSYDAQDRMSSPASLLCRSEPCVNVTLGPASSESRHVSSCPLA